MIVHMPIGYCLVLRFNISMCTDRELLSDSYSDTVKKSQEFIIIIDLAEQLESLAIEQSEKKYKNCCN